MWSCPVPYNSYMPPVNYSHAHASTYSAGMVGLQMAPFNMAAQPLYHGYGRTSIQVQNLGSRRFILDRSLYDLVKTSQNLESTDPKLLCWYLSLSTSDRKLIQDEGGLQQFLQRHPALEVRVREYTCVNFDAGDCYASHAANSNTRTTLNDVYACMTCGEKLWPGEKCSHCTTPIQKETTSLPDRESDLLPITVTDNLSRLEYRGGNGSEGASCQLGREQHPTDAPAYVQDGFPTAYCTYQSYQLGPGQQPTDAAINSQDSLWTVYNNSHLVNEPRHSDMEAHASKVQLLSQLWDEASQDSSNSFVNAYKDPSAQASFSLDVELDSRTAKLELVNRPTMTQAQSGYCQYGETSTLSWSKGEDDTANATSGEEATSVCESETDHFHSIMEEDESILECKMNPRVSGVNSAQDSPKVMVSIDTLMGKTSPEKSAEVKCSTAEKSTSPLPPTATCDISVMTESHMASCQSVATETMGPDTADKSVNTAVYMSDLDYLMEVFTRLKSVEVEFKELKAKMTRSGELMEVDADAMRCCACADRTKQAELSLLALQYRMCQQHCWRCYYNTAERDWFNPGPEEMYKYRSGSLPAKLASVLQTLESDYNEMRCKIQAGTTLDQLKPLSVSYTLGTESCYVPAQIIGDTLGSVPTSSSQQPQKQDLKVVGGNGNVHVGIFKRSQEKKDPAPQIKLDRRAGGSVESLLPDQSGTSSGPGDEQTCEFQGMNTSEAWYDAEEDLDPNAERKGVSAETTKEKKDGEEKETGLFLQVSNLPCTVTEADVISSSSSPGPSEVPLKPKTSKTESSNAAVKMIPQQLLRSSPKVKVVCVLPTARCTFVPQHYGTMGSFDTLMARLKERHPGVGSQAIVGALKELRVKHRGVLSGLPLREIENMASELLMARTTPP